MLFFTLLLLTGCGDEGHFATTEEIVLPEAGFSATDGIIHSKHGSITAIDLRQYVVNGRGANFTDVVSLQSSCNVPELNGTGFDVYPVQGVLCEYRYTAMVGSTEASATISVFGTQSVKPILPNLSYSIPANEVISKLNLTTLLGVDFPSGYTLEKVQRLDLDPAGGLNGLVAVSDSQSNTIEYISIVSESGWDQLRYNLVNEAKPEESVIGEIHIMSSRTDSKIQAPNIDYLPLLISRAPNTVIDLNSFITSPWEYQLIEVQSYSATVSKEIPSSVDNKGINFKTTMPGEHVVIYIIADYYGNYSMGLIRVQVAASQSDKKFADYDDSQFSGLTFTAPPLYDEDMLNIFNVVPVWVDSIQSTMAGFRSKQAAKNYCDSIGGLLPDASAHNIDILSRYASSNYVDQFFSKWPSLINHLYVVSQFYDSFEYSSGLLVTCTKFGVLKWKQHQTTVNVSDTFQDIGLLSLDDSNERPNFTVIPEKSSIEQTDFDISFIPISSKQLAVQVRSRKQGTLAVRFSVTSTPTISIDSSLMTFNIPVCDSVTESENSNCLYVERYDSVTAVVPGYPPFVPDRPYLAVMSPYLETLHSLGYTSDNTANNSGETYSLISPMGAYFRGDAAPGEKSQAVRWCSHLSKISFMGMENWTLPFYVNDIHFGDSNYNGFINHVNVRAGLRYTYSPVWLDSDIHNALIIGKRYITREPNDPSLTFCIAPLTDVDRLTLKVLTDGQSVDNFNVVEASMFYSNGTPAAGLKVEFTINNNAQIISAPGVTDINGKVIANLTSSYPGAHTVTASFTVPQTDTTASKIIFQSINVRFGK